MIVLTQHTPMNPTVMSNETMQSVQRYFAASRGNHQAEAMTACFADDCLVHDPADAPALKGHAELQQFFQSMIDLFSTVKLTEEFIAINGREAAVKWTGQGIGKNGREVPFEGIDLFEINADGRIQSLRAYWNPVPMLAMLQEES